MGVFKFEKPCLAIQKKAFQSIEWYNNYIHSAIGAIPIDTIMEGKEVKSMIMNKIYMLRTNV